MTRFFALVAVCLVGFGLLAGVASPAAAQQAGNESDNSSDGDLLDDVRELVEGDDDQEDGDDQESDDDDRADDPEANGTEPDVERHEVEQQVDQQVTLKGWTYNESEERFLIRLSVSAPSSLTIGEYVALEEAGSAQGNVYSERLPPGDHEIEFAARTGPEGHAGASIQTSRSLDQGRFVVISTGKVADTLPFEQTDSTTGWLGGATTAFVMIYAAGRSTIRQMKQEPQDV